MNTELNYGQFPGNLKKTNLRQIEKSFFPLSTAFIEKTHNTFFVNSQGADSDNNGRHFLQ